MTQRVYTDLEARGLLSMDFGDTLFQLRLGHKMTRRGWDNKQMFIKLQMPTAESKMTASYIYIERENYYTSNTDKPSMRVPWIPTQTDLLATDWIPYGN